MREIAIFSGLAAGLAGTWALLRFRITPAELERRRRTKVYASGRLIDGVCTDVRDGLIFYSYAWRGVEYASSQDITALTTQLPESLDLLIGGVTVKFLPNDPPNSIVVCEKWNGFRPFKHTRDNT